MWFIIVSKESQFRKDVEVKHNIYFKYQSIKCANLRTFLGQTFSVDVENLVIYVFYLSILSIYEEEQIRVNLHWQEFPSRSLVFKYSKKNLLEIYFE